MSRHDPTKWFGKPSDPKTMQCEWCEKRATCAYEIFKPLTRQKPVGTAQFLYACREHERQAQIHSHAPGRAA